MSVLVGVLASMKKSALHQIEINDIEKLGPTILINIQVKTSF